MTIQKPDGWIELGISGCCCPPGKARPGMHTNCATSWWRRDGGEWVSYTRQSHVRTLAAAAESVEEFLDCMKTGRV
jgi:hypothetical protein